MSSLIISNSAPDSIVYVIKCIFKSYIWFHRFRCWIASFRRTGGGTDASMCHFRWHGHPQWGTEVPWEEVSLVSVPWGTPGGHPSNERKGQPHEIRWQNTWWRKTTHCSCLKENHAKRKSPHRGLKQDNRRKGKSPCHLSSRERNMFIVSCERKIP